MKYKVITTKQGKFAIDEESVCNTGELYLSSIKQVIKPKSQGVIQAGDKIIATINHSVSLDVPMVIIKDEVEKLADAYIERVYAGIPMLNFEDRERKSTAKFAYIDAIREYSAQQKGGYSEEDLRKYHNIMCLSGNVAGEELIQSLKQEYIELQEEMLKDCNLCGRTVREQAQGCNDVACYKQHLKTIKTVRDKSGQLIAYLK